MQQMTFEELENASKIPIKHGDPIEEGDWITHNEWMNKAYLIHRKDRLGIWTRRRVAKNQFENGDMSTPVLWANRDEYFWNGNFYKVILGKEYDPKQQPYEDTDI
jgi:hypothetical protein